jgi:tetratricopeptide (TPR) repeat protein
MKKYIYTLIVFSLTVSFVGCSDYLDQEPETFFTEEQVFSTENGVEAAVNGMYQNFAGPGYHGSAIHGLVAPFSGKFFSNQGASQDATSLNCLPSNTWLTRLWPGMYSAINNANTIIANLEDSTLSNRDVALGQAYFIRAATYFDLVRYFGGVPIKTEVDVANINTLNAPRATKEQVYDLIIEDFERAKLLLPNPGEYLSDRPVKTAANAFLAKVYLTLASESNDIATWQKAYDEAILVYNQYSLVPTYAGLFEQGNQNTNEAIFELQYGQNGSERNSDVIRIYTPNGYFKDYDTFGRVRPNKEVYEQHIDQYPGDPRIDATFLANSYDKYNSQGVTTPKNIYPDQVNGNDGFTVLKKYFDDGYNGATTNRNFIKLRYADVLLMLAEITNELNGPTPEAYGYVNEVMTRARNTDSGVVASPADFSGLSQDEFRTRIMRERQYELLGENHSFFDTRRRGYEYFLEEVIETHNNFGNLGNKDFTYPITVKNMLLPIPITEISNNTQISDADQNPGY